MLVHVVLERLPRWASQDVRAPAAAVPSAAQSPARRTLIPVLVCVYLSTAIWTSHSSRHSLERRTRTWRTDQLGQQHDRRPRRRVHRGLKNAISYGFLNPLQTLLADTPWWLMAPVLLAISWVIGGLKPLLTTLVCEAVILGSGSGTTP